MPTSDEELRAVTIGERRPHEASIHLVPYDPAWPAHYETLARRIRAALAERAICLEHVGSTAVPGLCAKPVIDIAQAVTDSGDEAAYLPALETQGFYLRIREPAWYAHRMLKARDIECNLHVFSAGCEEIARMVSFRDRLRDNQADRRTYEQEKRHLAAQTWRHVQNYADAKTMIVREILARQEEETR
jgi:GrpB-like predicted nucleotidyltransferase (UPF0157 family)